MLVNRPAKPSGLYFLTDVRLLRDKNTQEETGGCPVFAQWPFGYRTLGRSNWARATRVALWDYGSQVSDTDGARRSVRDFLATEQPAATVVMQTRSKAAAAKDKKQEGADAKGLKTTTCWAALDAPDSLPEMAGTVWDSPYGPVVPLLNPSNHEHVFSELCRRHLQRAHDLATGKVHVFRSPGKVSEPGPEMEAALRHMLKTQGPLAVDIETYSTANLITAINLADGRHSVSVPWDAFPIFPTDEIEPGGDPTLKGLVALLIGSGRPLLFHNYTFDVPRLRDAGLDPCGPIHDTYAMMGIVYRQFPKGLQRACATEFACAPWKSLWHPKAPPGYSKADAEYWTMDPHALRDYGADDAGHTWELGRHLHWKCGLRGLYP